MKSFLFEQYGYYPIDLKDGMYTIDGWKFKLIEVEFDESNLDKIDEYLEKVKNNFNNLGPYIIKTRLNNKMSFYDNKKYVLISIKENTVSFSDLNKFHIIFNDNQSIDLREVLKAWQVRSSIIEQDGLMSLRVDSPFYSDNLECTMFCLGMCQNAMQYLSEAVQDYGNKLDNLTITHKRIYNFDSFDFFNPFNFVIDHPIRDFVELYRNDFINLAGLIELLEFYKIDSKLATIFIARLMYPVNVFDALEENVEKKEKNLKLNYFIEKEFYKIKNVYQFFREKYNIRPINWLEK